MRYINLTGFNPRKLRMACQKKKRALVLSPTISAKKDFLDIKANQVWVNYKVGLERLSHHKCWFSEAYASVSDFHVEHFRPKKKIDLIRSKDAYPERRTTSDTSGYWWLSYELENFRLAGGKPNQLKGNYFPLETTSVIASELNESWRQEIPILLDPCIEEDTRLITYDGVEPKEKNSNPDSLEHVRARISIKVYGLKIQKLRNARSRVYEEAKNYCENARTNWIAMKQYKGNNEEAYNLAKENFCRNCDYLVIMLKPSREFTKMVLAFLDAANLDWIEKYIISEARAKGYIG